MSGIGDASWDAVVVGAGVVGAMVARELTAAGKRVLVLEAGRAMALADEYASYESYRSYVESYQGQLIKIPNSPYPANASAQSPYATDNVAITEGTPDLKGYWVQTGRYPFMSSYLRQAGGTTLHWMGSCPRHVPADFELSTRYGRGLDWPLRYDDLQAYYCRAEWEMGVAADRVTQEYDGITFPPGYDYPMEAIPASWLDQVVAERTRGLKVRIGPDEKDIVVATLPVARNAVPRRFPDRPSGPGGDPPWNDYAPRGAVGAPHIGLRCEGNSSCVPICPVQAKYSALKTLARLDPKLCTIQAQTVATTVETDENGRVVRLNYKRYDAEGGGFTEGSVRAGIFVLAAHCVENAKILLASDVANASDQVGRNLMDHPYFMTWALAPEDLGSFRGPGYTSGISSFRDGEFRRETAAFRVDMGNWGWNFSAGAPFSDVGALVADGVVGRELRTSLGRTVPRQMRFGFQIEQLPEARNRVTLDRTYLDGMGIPRPVIAYDVSDYTWTSMLEAIEISTAVFDRMGVAPDQRFHLGNAGMPTYHEIDGVPLSFYGSGHLAGTHRMGDDPKTSVVNPWQRAHDHDNLWVVGCGSFPTIATANPTLTAAALALRSTEDMLRRLRPLPS